MLKASQRAIILIKLVLCLNLIERAPQDPCSMIKGLKLVGDKPIDLLYDEDIWRRTKGFAGVEYYAHRRSVLQIGQLKSNGYC